MSADCSVHLFAPLDGMIQNAQFLHNLKFLLAVGISFSSEFFGFS